MIHLRCSDLVHGMANSAELRIEPYSKEDTDIFYSIYSPLSIYVVIVVLDGCLASI